MKANQIMVKMVLDRWNTEIKKFTDIVNSISDNQLMKEIAPGKNRGIYLLGHLVGVHDDTLPVLNFGNKLYPELFEIFIKSPDKTVAHIPPAAELRTAWKLVNEQITGKMNSLSADDWFYKHNSVSAEDFVKEPYRNKLNIIITRTTHLCYHAGQIVLLK
ncbi:MAG: DinB family protein [Sphingobacteriales bacterium]